jgi:hypothetical protein
MIGDEAPGKKDFIIVLTAVAILIILSLIAHFVLKIS